MRFLRWITRPKRMLGIVFALFCVFWLYNGPEILSQKPGQAESNIIAEFTRSNPKAAAWIAQQQNRFGVFNTAVAIESLPGQSLNSEALKQSVEIRARLTSLYQQEQVTDPSVLWSHGTAIEAMNDIPGDADQYLTSLEEAKLDQDYWSLVRNDPVALSSKLLKSNLMLRKTYQDNRDWYLAMTEVLVAMIGITSDTSESEDDAGFIELDDLLIVANQSEPHLRQLAHDPIASPLEACIYYETFRQFGQTISMAAKQGVPPKEAAEVIILNRDVLLSESERLAGTKVEDPASVAAKLVTIYRDRPSVWVAAQRDGFVLSFDQLVPQHSQSVLQKHADLGAASLIVTQYADVATQAAAIVDRYGELGMAVLVQYVGSEVFYKLLQNANVDHRIAMVAVLQSDKGLESVLKDPSYIDKWIAETGDPIADQWWVNVPGGGIAKVAVNYTQGVPSDWSEIGWAAWDVADVGLLVVSLGGTKMATEVGKQAAKQVGKSAASKLTKTGVRRLAGAAKPTAMARFIKVAKASKVAAPIRWTSRTIISTVRSTTTMGGKLMTATNRVIQTAKSIPPGMRIWVARGLLGASLFVRGPDRIRKLIGSLTDIAREKLTDAIDTIPLALSDAIRRINQIAADAWSGEFSPLLNVCIIGVCAVVALCLLLDIGPQVSFVGSGGASSTRRRTKPKSKS